jgi:hypothetical protein
MPTYELVNPYIVGGMKKTFNSADSNQAANEAWDNLSKYVTNNVPKFAFTIRKVSDGKLFHYLVKEKLTKNKAVDFSIKELKLNLTPAEEIAFTNHIQKVEDSASGKMVGGKKHKHKKDDSSDSDSNSDSDNSSSSDEIYDKIRNFRNKNQPLSYLWYSPLVYNKDGNVTSVYIPSFTYPIVPYIELYLTGIIWNLNNFK